MIRWLWLLVLAPLSAWAQDLVGHGGPVRALAVLPGGIVASASFDHSVIWWDAAAGRARQVARWHDGAVNALAALPDGRLASAGEDGKIALWPAGGANTPARVLAGHTAPVAALLALPGGGLASAGWDGTVRRWGADGAAAGVLEGHQGQVNALALRADGTLLSAGYDGTLRAWDASGQGRVLAEFGLPQNALAALPDGSVAAAGADGTLRLVRPGGEVRELEAGTRPVVALVAAPEGRTLAAATLGGSVALWALPEGRLRLTLEGPGLPVWSAAFSADGATLWTGGQDRRVRRWDAARGTPLGAVVPEAEATAPPGLDLHGAQVFRACAACHSLTAEGGNMAGPTLHGLFGRQMGRAPGYAYSERLARGDVVWTPETVSRLFTEGPDVMLPGTKMPVQRVDNAEDLTALLRFLQATTR